jgi:hypothetical protein
MCGEVGDHLLGACASRLGGGCWGCSKNRASTERADGQQSHEFCRSNEGRH